MRRMIAMGACVLVCLSLLTGCTSNRDADSESDLVNSVEFHIDAEGKGDFEISSDDNSIVYDFKDPDNAEGIVLVPKE